MNADREEKSTYANSTCSGKLCDYLFLVTIVQSYVHESVKLQILDLILTTIYLQSNGNQEIGIGENSGPKRKYHHDKSINSSYPPRSGGITLNFPLNCGPARGHNFTRNLVNLSTSNAGDKIVIPCFYNALCGFLSFLYVKFWGDN